MISFNRFITICSVFVIPLFSALVWLVMMGTQLVDKVNAQGTVLQSVVAKVDALSVKVDSVSQRQRDYIKDTDHRFDVLNLTRNTAHGGYVYQRYINGKLVPITIN
jgi:hypothetical protein